MINTKRLVKKALKYLLYAALFIIVLGLALISPYLLKNANDVLNTRTKIDIPLADYLNYMSALLIGLLAVVISIMAYTISKTAERREQNHTLFDINRSKRALEHYIKENGQVFFNITKSVGSLQSLHQIDEIDQDIERLHSSGILNDDEEQKCRMIVKYVSEGLNKNRTKDDSKLVSEFASTFLDPNIEAFQLNSGMQELVDKLSTKSD